MANTDTQVASQVPDWWAREKRKQQTRILIFLVLMLLLIGYYYWVSLWGRIGKLGGVNFDSTNYIAFIRLEEKERPDNKGKETVSTLCAVRADGSDLRPLTPPDDNANKADPAWTVDGKSLLYASNRDDSHVTQIYVLGDGGPKQLTYGTGNKFAPVASPDGQHVAFVTQGAVKTVLLNGNDVYQVMPPPRSGNASAEDPGAMAQVAGEPRGPFRFARFSSDGQGIAGVQDVNNDLNPADLSGMAVGDQVARAIAPGGNKALILDTGHDVDVAWEPNGTRLACAFTELQMADRSGKPQMLSGIRLWSFDRPDKPHPTPLITFTGNSLAPRNLAWSSDGSKMAFEAWKLKGDGVRELGGIVAVGTSQPNAFFTPADVSATRYMIPAQGSGKPHNPQWSPDGSRLLFEMTRPDGGNDLWVINADGTNPLNLTKGAGNNTQAVWAPMRKK